jgi:ABC-type Mn2+/Zn2+ transport system permease subunit
MCATKLGTLVSALGVIWSVKIDIPTGATIVVTLWRSFDADVFLAPDSPSRTPPEGATSSRHEV